MDSKKIKIQLLMEGAGLGDIDMSHPDLGNPGIGGTQFCFLLLAYYLTTEYPDKYSVEFLSVVPLRVPSGVDNKVMKNIESLPEYTSPGCILIVKAISDLGFYTILEKCKDCNIITWAHNFLFGPVARRISNMPNVKANVFVSKQMYDFYIDDDIIEKSLPIFNIVPDINVRQRIIPKVPTLTFMGQISEAKGIITLLKIWKIVSAEIPQAQLNILGGGNLYNRNSSIGTLGITDEATEKKMLPFITDKEGKLLPNIHFLGILGKEKYDVFSSSTVGIVNPSASTETFGMGIIEMASCSLPVVTKAWNGHPDTAIDGKTALLGLSINSMAKKIITLFKDSALNLKLGDNAKSAVSRFSPTIIISQWDTLLDSLHSNKIINNPKNISKPYWNNYKFVRAANRTLRFGLHLKFIPSIVSIESWAYFTIKKIAKLKNLFN